MMRPNPITAKVMRANGSRTIAPAATNIVEKHQQRETGFVHKGETKTGSVRASRTNGTCTRD